MKSEESSKEKDFEIESRSALIGELEFRQERESRKNAMRMIIFIAGLSLVMIGLFCWIQPESVSNLFTYGEFDISYPSHRNVLSNVNIFGGIFILVSTAFFAYLYMVGFNPRKQRQKDMQIPSSDSSVFEKESIAIVALLKSIDSSLEKGKLESVLSDNERSEVIRNISSTVDSHLNDSLLSKIEGKYGLAIYGDKLSNHAENALGGTIERLKDYAEDLSAKASVNLVYGIGATISAIGILTLILLNASPPENSSDLDAIFYYISRLFLVVLVQGVSIFFLNLYKTTLSNVLYINNEITNHEAKRDALAITLRTGNKEAISAMLISLSITERNFTLKKGEASIYDKGAQQRESPISANMIAEVISKLKASPNA